MSDESASTADQIEEHLDAIRRSLQTIAFWIGLAVALSVVGGIYLGVQASQEQDRLEQILNGDTGEDSDCPAYASYC